MVSLLFWNKKRSANPKLQKVRLRLSGMHCVSCSLNVDGALEDLDGVMMVETSYARSETTVQFDPDKVALPQIQKTIEQLGYTVVSTEKVNS